MKYKHRIRTGAQKSKSKLAIQNVVWEDGPAISHYVIKADNQLESKDKMAIR